MKRDDAFECFALLSLLVVMLAVFIRLVAYPTPESRGDGGFSAGFAVGIGVGR